MEPRVCVLGFDAARGGRYTRRDAGKAEFEPSKGFGTRWERYCRLKGSKVEVSHAARRDTNTSAPEGT